MDRVLVLGCLTPHISLVQGIASCRTLATDVKLRVIKHYCARTQLEPMDQASDIMHKVTFILISSVGATGPAASCRIISLDYVVSKCIAGS